MAEATVFVPTPKAGVRLMLSYEEAKELRGALADAGESPRLDAIYNAVGSVLNEIIEQPSGDDEVRPLASSRVPS